MIKVEQFALVIAVLITAAIVHEIGHYVAYRFFGYKPDIRIKWYGVLIGENIWHRVTCQHAVIILLAGFLAGLPVVLFNDVTLAIYILMSMVDLVNIITILSVPVHLFREPIIDSWKHKIKEIEGGVS